MAHDCWSPHSSRPAWSVEPRQASRASQRIYPGSQPALFSPAPTHRSAFRVHSSEKPLTIPVLSHGPAQSPPTLSLRPGRLVRAVTGPLGSAAPASLDGVDPARCVVPRAPSAWHQKPVVALPWPGAVAPLLCAPPRSPESTTGLDDEALGIPLPSSPWQYAWRPSPPGALPPPLAVHAPRNPCVAGPRRSPFWTEPW